MILRRLLVQNGETMWYGQRWLGIGDMSGFHNEVIKLLFHERIEFLRQMSNYQSLQDYHTTTKNPSSRVLLQNFSYTRHTNPFSLLATPSPI
jgi:hypothetical protein